ncbi:MAG: hemerythrin domain-containing protein [Reyranellales bacterium]
MVHVDMKRRWLIGAAGVVLAAPALADARRQTAARKKSAEPVVTATEDLMREHGVLERILLIYDASIRRLAGGEDFDPAVFTQTAETMRDFIHDYHEKSEEEQVFPCFKTAGRMVELVEVLLVQHAAGRQLTERILKAAPASSGNREQRTAMVEAMKASLTLYRPHIAREDTDIFPTLRSLVTPSEFDAMAEAFEKAESAKFGGDGFEKMAKRVEQLEKRIGIHDLSQFTPKT